MMLSVVDEGDRLFDALAIYRQFHRA